ncbi:MAG: ATP-binding protein, partial [bacterium]|nr:ATP-binding protein [bacterium]
PPERYPDCFALQQSKGITDLVEKDAWFQADTDLLKMLSRMSRPEPTGELIADMATPKEIALLEQFHPGLVIPLIYQARLSGIFIIGDKMSNRDFQMDDIEFLSILGSQISVAIENARLYRAEMAATRQLREAQEQLVHTERLAALGEMSAKVAHEINNPLGIIQNYVLLVRRTTEGNKEASNYIDVVGHEISRIARIVQELLDFTRPTPSDFAEVDLKELAEEVLSLMSPQFSKQKVEVIREFPDEEILVKGLSENIRQVLMNILINALDVLPGGGQIRVGLLKEDGKAILRVCDTGPGIESAIVPHIFEPFFTTKDPGKGTGLGLSVCYGIIKRHGGNITYKNIEGGGCFRIAIPAMHGSHV